MLMHFLNWHHLILVGMAQDLYNSLLWFPIDIRKKLRVTMINALQLEEAGYGEGVLREFLNELIKESFDPNRGLFCRTDQQELFPNPQVSHLTCCHGYMVVL